MTTLVLHTETFDCTAVQYGKIEEMNVCDNLGDHLVGNVYVKVQILCLDYVTSK